MIILLYILPLLSIINLSLSSKSTHNILTFTHQMSTSHLSFVFNIAENYPSPKQIYDIRWPMLDSVEKFASRKSFHKLIFSKAWGSNDILAKDFNWTEFKGNFPKIIDSLFLPCMLQDPFPAELIQQNASLALIDPYATGCSIAIARNFNAKYVFVSPVIEACTLQYYSGGPLPSSYVMSVFAMPKMNIFQRAVNVFFHQIFRGFFYQLPLAKMFNYFDSTKDFLYSIPKPTLVIVNNHKFFGFPAPKTNALIDVANSLPPFENEISKDVETFISHYDEVVLLSFSTYINDGVVSSKLYSNYLKVFKSFPKIGFIWRQKEKLEDLPENVLTVSWINQRAVISHAKVKVLITHCGLNSVVEGLNVGIPMICIPQGNDQHYNSEKLRHASISAIHDQQTLSADELTISLKEILNSDSTIRKNSLKMKEMLKLERDQNISTNITWILTKFEKMKTSDFERFYIPKGSQLSWNNYFLIDWIFVIFGITVSITVF